MWKSGTSVNNLHFEVVSGAVLRGLPPSAGAVMQWSVLLSVLYF